MKLSDLKLMSRGDDLDYLAAGDNAAIIFDKFVSSLHLPDNDLVSKLLLEKLERTQFQRDEMPLVKGYYELVQSRRRGAKEHGILRFIKRHGVK